MSELLLSEVQGRERGEVERQQTCFFAAGCSASRGSKYLLWRGGWGAPGGSPGW